MLFVGLLSICLVRCVFGSNETCMPGVSLEQLKHLHVSDFASPWGTENIETFCGYLDDFYGCVDANDDRWSKGPIYEPVFKYFQNARNTLEELCTVTEPYYEEYKKHEACYLGVRNGYNKCRLHAAALRHEYFEVPKKWPKNDVNVNECIKGTELFFCMVDRIQRICDDPKAVRFYLQIAKGTELSAIYCNLPQLFDVQVAIKKLSRDYLVETIKRSEEET